MTAPGDLRYNTPQLCLFKTKPQAEGDEAVMNLPEPVAKAVQPLFDALPPEQAMERLVVHEGAPADLRKTVAAILEDPVIQAQPALAAGLWLYVDELDHSHEISQGMHDSTGSFWHGIMHRREGDFGNSHYWFRRTGRHPAMDQIPGYDPHRFIDSVEENYRAGDPHLAEMQRREWRTLFEWCAAQGR